MDSRVYRELLKAVNRIEKKLDEVIKRQDDEKSTRVPLQWQGQTCPLCAKPVKYLRKVVSNDDGQPIDEVIIRKCGCEPTVTEMFSGV